MRNWAQEGGCHWGTGHKRGDVTEELDTRGGMSLRNWAQEEGCH